MKLLVSKLAAPKNSADITESMAQTKIVTQSIWQQINAAEIAAGEPLGKPRRKAVTREELLKLGRL